MTRERFLEEYRTRLLGSGKPWVKTAGNHAVEQMLRDARSTLETTAGLWSIGPIAQAAWKAIGGKGRASLPVLRRLPSGPVGNSHA